MPPPDTHPAFLPAWRAALAVRGIVSLSRGKVVSQSSQRSVMLTGSA